MKPMIGCSPWGRASTTTALSINPLGLVFAVEGCTLDNSSFYKLKLRKSFFRNSRLCQVDFTESDLTQSVFEGCDLSGATFDQAVLEGADFRTAYGYTIDPDKNRVRGAKFSFPGAAGLLDKYGIQIE